MTFHIIGNLDQEAIWLGTPQLSARAQRTSSAYSALLAALAPCDDVTVWAHAPVDPDRLVTAPGWTPPTMCVGAAPQIDLLWADPSAKAVNDRRFSFQLTTAWGCALPGARVLRSVAELEHHLAAWVESTACDGAWVCKAVWSSAGRERVYGRGVGVDANQRAQLERLFERTEPAVVFEPWLPRVSDVGICGSVSDKVSLHPPHQLLSTARGGFAGIDLRQVALEHAERDALVTTAERVGRELQHMGYRGPFGVDAFVYRDGDERRLHPLCEINARYTFGHVARALGERIGISTLQFSTPPPPGAIVFVRQSRNDSASVWASLHEQTGFARQNLPAAM